MRPSRAGAPSMAVLPWPTKAERSKTSRGAPTRVSPQFSPVRPGTGSSVPVHTASNLPKGAPARLLRRSVMSLPCQVSSIVPSMGAPDQGWYRFFSAI